jgi:hypothetical protein
VRPNSRRKDRTEASVTAVCEFAVSSCDEHSPMITGDPDRAITFTVADRAAMDHQLEAAVASGLALEHHDS